MVVQYTQHKHTNSTGRLVISDPDFKTPTAHAVFDLPIYTIREIMANIQDAAANMSGEDVFHAMLTLQEFDLDKSDDAIGSFLQKLYMTELRSWAPDVFLIKINLQMNNKQGYWLITSDQAIIIMLPNQMKELHVQTESQQG